MHIRDARKRSDVLTILLGNFQDRLSVRFQRFRLVTHQFQVHRQRLMASSKRFEPFVDGHS